MRTSAPYGFRRASPVQVSWLAMVTALAAATSFASAACAQMPPRETHPMIGGAAAERAGAMVMANKALSAENRAPATAQNVVSVTDADVVAQARALSDKAGHNGLYYDYYRFKVALAKVHTTHADLFDIPKATYRLYPPGDVPSFFGILELRDLSHVVIDGHGSTLLFYYIGKPEAPLTSVHLRGGIDLEHSDHITLRNLTIDYDEALVAPATVAGQPGAQTLTIDRAFPINPAVPWPVRVFIPFDVARRTFGSSRDMSAGDFAAWAGAHAPGGMMPYTCAPPSTGMSASTCFRYVGGQTYAFGPNERLSPVPPTASNFFASVRDNNYAAVVVGGGASYLTFDGVTIYSSPGGGIIMVGAGEAIHITHCRITRKPDALLSPGEPRRLISTIADGMNVITSRGDVVIEDSEIGYQADDGLNIRGAVRNGTALGPGTIQAPTSGGPAYFQVGGLVDIFGDKGTRQIAAGVPIARVTPPGPGQTLYTVYLAPGAAPMKPGATYAIGVRDWSSSNVVVRNTWFHDSSERGIILHGNNIAIIDNRFDRTAESAVQILYENKSGNLEGLAADNVVISGNVIHDVNTHWFDSATRELAAPAAISVYMEQRSGFGGNDGFVGGDVMPRHLAITDNVIDHVPGAGILVSQADDVILARNHLSSTGMHMFGQSAIDGNAIVAERVTGLHATGNSADAAIVLPGR